LPTILRGEEIWCQGFSEPDAGSDLASLRTRADRDGDCYIVTGQKTWTSHSPVADFCEMLVRTDGSAPKHKGISWLIVPMDAPGITIRPLRTIMGSSDFAEVFLDGVQVPVGNRVGDENDGWGVARVTLQFERGTAYTQELWNSVVLLRRLVDLARRTPVGSGSAWDDAGVRRQFGRLGAELYGLRALMLRSVSESAAGDPPYGDASVFKLHFTELRQRLMGLGVQLWGRAGLLLDDLEGLENGYVRMEALRSLSLTIAGGTSQIQRNIIAERTLGLPRSG
jgi:alkylation response protein AidB-like acyl-CoA dehydrogenase